MYITIGIVCHSKNGKLNRIMINFDMNLVGSGLALSIANLLQSPGGVDKAPRMFYYVYW